MKVYETNDIRNVALLGHGHSGKTSLAAGALFASGATARLTRVDEGNTITDFDEEEVARKLTILTAVAAVEWNKKEAARVLDISRGTLYRKILEYGLDHQVAVLQRAIIGAG